MTSREQFEAWWKTQRAVCQFAREGSKNGAYHSKPCQSAWEAWQASREAVEVEIDNHTEFEIEHMICLDKDGYSVGWIDGRNYAVKQVSAAGIKVKGE